jgi:hypothetical protein
LLLFASALVLTVVAGCSDDDEPDVIGLGNDVVGTCLDFGDEIEDEITTLPEVACEDPHTHEIFAVEQTDAETYPGLEALEADAQALCLGQFEDYVGVNPFDSELFVSWLVPTLTSWDRDDDREIICVIGEDNGAPLVGSVRDVAR